MKTPAFGLKVRYRPYQCSACGHEQEVQSNHTDHVFAVCQHCSWMANKYPGVSLFGTMHRVFKYTGGPPTADEINPNARGGEQN